VNHGTVGAHLSSSGIAVVVAVVNVKQHTKKKIKKKTPSKNIEK